MATNTIFSNRKITVGVTIFFLLLLSIREKFLVSFRIPHDTYNQGSSVFPRRKLSSLINEELHSFEANKEIQHRMNEKRLLCEFLKKMEISAEPEQTDKSLQQLFTKY